MQIKNVFLLMFSLVLSLTFVSCEDDSNDDELLEENGFTREINEFIPQNILTELNTLGFNLYPGATPPTVNGTFVSSPHVLYASNNASDDIGKEYNDKTFEFKNQDNDDLTINVTISQGSKQGTGTGAFIVGKDGKFTVFVEINFQDTESEGKYKAAQIITGEITDAGIKNLMSAFVMLDDYGDPTDSYTEVGRIRIIKDNDGIGEKTVSKSATLRFSSESDN